MTKDEKLQLCVDTLHKLFQEKKEELTTNIETLEKELRQKYPIKEEPNEETKFFDLCIELTMQIEHSVSDLFMVVEKFKEKVEEVLGQH